MDKELLQTAAGEAQQEVGYLPDTSTFAERTVRGGLLQNGRAVKVSDVLRRSKQVLYECLTFGNEEDYLDNIS